MDRSGRQDGPIEPPADPPGDPPIDPGALIEAVAERAAGHAAVELAIDPTFPARIRLPEPPFTAAVEALVAAAGPVIELCCGRIERVGDAGRRQVGLRVTVTGDAALADVPPEPWRALDGRLRVEPPTAGRVTVHGELWPPRVEEATPPLPKRLVGRALVVEDHPRVRAMLVHALEGGGYVCDAAPSFDEALRQLGARREGHALLLVDGDLPTAPAPAAARVFAELAAQRGTVALLMGPSAGAAPSVDKPLTRARLAAALAAITAARDAAPVTARDPAARDAAPVTTRDPAAPDTAARDTTDAAARPPHHVAPGRDPERPAPVVHIALDPALADLLPDFVRNRAADVHQLRAALAAGDEATARRICHGIKGCGGAFGFPRLSALGAAIGQEARAGRLATTGPAIDELDDLVTAIAAAVGVELTRE
ncbi:MAG: Hpt domain-containing protein [Myxococcales bacterium]|nr:Hpt domain-containing protein [Myxococcales bacterium]